MKVDTANRSVVFVKLLQQSAHPVVPQLTHITYSFTVFSLYSSLTCMTPLCREASIQGLVGWKERPFTRGDFVSNLVSIVIVGQGVWKTNMIIITTIFSSYIIIIVLSMDLTTCCVRYRKENNILKILSSILSDLHFWQTRGF